MCECVCLSEKKRKESKCEEERWPANQKSEGVCEMWWVVIVVGGAPKNI